VAVFGLMKMEGSGYKEAAISLSDDLHENAVGCAGSHPSNQRCAKRPRRRYDKLYIAWTLRHQLPLAPMLQARAKSK